MTTVRKLLLAVLLVSLAGSAFGAGTFASFNATTTNASSTFATGSLVLSNKVNSSTTCLSTGGGNTDTNANSVGCGTLFATTVSKPGDTATVDLDLSGVGTLSGSKLAAYGQALCTSGANAVATYTGTGDICEQTQFTLQEFTSAANRTAGTVSGGRCWFGTGNSATVTGSTINFPVTVTGSNNTLKIAFDNLTALNITIPSASYTSPTLLEQAIQTAIRSAATSAGQAAQQMVGGTWVATGTTGTITIASAVPGTSGKVDIQTPAGNSANSLLGLTVATTAGTAGTTCTSDSAHSLASFTSAYTSSSLSLDMGALAGNSAVRYYRLTLALPSTAGNDVQGRQASFGLTWRLDQ